MSMSVRASACLLVLGASAALAYPGRAHAIKDFGDAGRGLYIEPSLGFMIPLGEDEYEDIVDISFKLGVPGKLGYLFRAGPILIGPELATDFTPFNDDDDLAGDVDLFRFRFLGCVRIVIPIPRLKRLRLVARMGMGLDLVFGEWGREDDASAGLGVEFSFGVEFLVHRRVAIGGLMAFPMAFHPEHVFSRDDYFAADLDYMFYVSIFVFP